MTEWKRWTPFYLKDGTVMYWDNGPEPQHYRRNADDLPAGPIPKLNDYPDYAHWLHAYEIWVEKVRRLEISEGQEG